MKKTINYINGKLVFGYDFNEEYVRTIFTIKANEGYVAFTNRDPMSDEDLDGNEISWGICDDLVSMGLLEEDEEAFDVAFILTKDGENAINIVSDKI